MSEERQRQEATTTVPTRGGEPREPGPEPQYPDDDKLRDEDEDTAFVEMTEEDRLLKERIEEAMKQVQSTDESQQEEGVGTLRKEIQQSTSSMTSVPKPLKFLLPHYDRLKKTFESWTSSSKNRLALADVISVVGMIAGYEQRETLKYRLLGQRDDIGAWGHEYLRHLAGEVSQEYEERIDKDQSVDDLLELVRQIVPYNMQHNAEPEAIDLLLETGQLRSLLEGDLVDEHNRERVSLYLLRCGEYLGDAEESTEAFQVTFELHMKEKQYAHALRLALRLVTAGGTVNLERTRSLIQRVLDKCPDAVLKKQMAFMLAKHHFRFEMGDDEADSLNRNDKLKQYYDTLARELDTVAPKTPEDIYKSHLSETASLALRDTEAGAQVESARGNLASSFVNAFVNAAYGTDTLVTPEDSTWLSRNKGDYKMSAAASLGLVHMWNVDEISAPDKFLYVEDDAVKAGGLLAIGLICTGIAPEDEPAFALLEDYVSESSEQKVTPLQRRSALLGLSLSYAGSGREDIAAMLYPYIQDTGANASFETACVAALGVGFVLVGTANDDAAAVIADRLMECSETEFKQTIVRHMCLGLALLYLSQGDAAEAMEATIDAIPSVAGSGEPDDVEMGASEEKTAETADKAEDGGDKSASEGDDRNVSKFVDKPANNVARLAKVLLKACANAGTGNVLAIQQLLHLCAEHPQAESEAKARKNAEDQEENEGQQPGQTGSAAGASGGATGGGAAAGGSSERQQGGQESDSDSDATVKSAYVYQSAAVVGLALVSMGEPLSVDMLSRMTDHLLQYGDISVKRAVPLALALSHVSDPDYGVIDVLSKLTHDHDAPTAQAAILAMGIAGAGTNNSRIAGLLRQLTTFYSKEADFLYLTRIAQGLLHAGKGLITMSAMHSDRLLMNRPAVAALMSILICGFDLRETLAGNWHWLLYSIAPALSTRMLMAVDSETLEPVTVEVRVGQGMETVGQAGKPKSITGFQTHNTPVLLSAGDRAEVVDTDKWTPLAPILEGVVLLKKNYD